ncbi:hypothetical protein J3458_021231 [Metarhizium acridum]|uniref:uncharacterized protein n=1 Tax=Metarhizium acridum TaxID=92637 RepID=UPI001C6D1B82|nr:hypothetical protein J3458_021231 [Metarhizium acridum]
MFQDWQRGNGLERLALPLSSGKIAAQAAECLFHYVSKRGKSSSQSSVCLYFEFSSSDVRRNSIKSMLYTVLAQITSRRYEGAARENITSACRKIFRNFEQYKWWNRDDLFAFFMEMMLNLGASDTGVIIMLGGLEEGITSCDWFLTNLNKLAEECELNLKLLVTTLKDAQPGEMALWPQLCVNAEEKPKIETSSLDAVVAAENDTFARNEDNGKESAQTCLTEDIETMFKPAAVEDLDVEFELLRLARAGSRAESDYIDLSHLLRECKEDKDLRMMVVDWYQARSSSSSIDRLVAQIPSSSAVTPESVFKAILSFLPVPMDRFLSNILNLLIYSFRPLSVSELNELAGWGEESQPAKWESSPSLRLHPRIQIPLRGLVQINKIEVQLAHPSLRRYLLSDKSPFKSSQEQAHEEIANMCFEFMSTRSRESIRAYRRSHKAVFAVEWRKSFLNYAVRWCLSHAELSEAGKLYSTHQSENFWKNTWVVGAWASMRWALQNPFTRGSIERGSPMTIVASHGLSRALPEVIGMRSPEASDEHFHQEVTQSLEAAAGNGELNTVLELLKHSTSSFQALDNVILSAIQSRNTQVAIEAVKFGLERPQRIQDVNLLLHRASSVGAITIVQMLLTLATATGLKNALVPEHSALQYACIRGNLEAVKLLVVCCDISSTHTDNARLLELACKYGQAEIVSFLTSDEASQNEVTNRYDTAAKLAIEFGNYRALDFLLKSRKLHNIEADVAMSMVNTVIDTGHVKCWNITWNYIQNSVNPKYDIYAEAMKKAMRSGVGPVYCDMLQSDSGFFLERYSGFLTEAITQEYPLQAIEAIVTHGGGECLPAKTNLALGNALNLAISHDREDVVRFLVRLQVPLKNKDQCGRTPLHQAASCGNVRIARILIEAGADVETEDEQGWRPVHAGCANADVIRLLLQNGADVNARTHKGNTPILFASSASCDAVLEALLEAGDKVEPDVKQKALNQAIIKDQAAAVRRLLDAGADPRKLPSRGTDQLIKAVQRGNAAIVRMLLEYGINLEEAKDRCGNSVLNCATDFKTRRPDDSIIKSLVRRGSNVNSPAKDGYTPLCKAVWDNNVEITLFLISNGAMVNTDGGPFGGPLILACVFASFEMVKLLCKHGADTNIIHPGIFGSPLHAALQRNPGEEKDSIIKYLLEDAENKADPTVSSMWWGGPLNLAVLNLEFDVAKTLRKKGAKVDA